MSESIEQTANRLALELACHDRPGEAARKIIELESKLSSQATELWDALEREKALMSRLDDERSKVEALQRGYSRELDQYQTSLHELSTVCNDLRSRLEAALSALYPRTWTLEQSRAWHRAIPDVMAAFAALRESSGVVESGQTTGQLSRESERPRGVEAARKADAVEKPSPLSDEERERILWAYGPNGLAGGKDL